MAVELGTAYVSITATAKDLGRSISHEISGPLEDEGRRAGDRAGQGFSGAFGGHLKSVAIAAGSAIAAIGVGTFLKGSVEAASDFNEVLSKSNTVFKDQAGEIEAWSKTAGKGFGQSQRSALSAASSFGNMFRQLGIGGVEAAKMSTQMVELASDFASFHNADISDVLEAQQAAFRGEYDSVQRFVPTITAATVEQKALALGLAGSTKELTAQDKAIATQALLLEGAGDAMGDFDRTAQSLANQQRILGALWDDAKVQLGTALLPAVTAVVRFLVSSGIPAFLGFADTVSGVVDTVAGAIRTIAGIISSGGTENELQSGMQGVIERIGLAALEVVNLVRDNWPAIRDIAQEVGQKLGEMAVFVYQNRDAFAAVIVPLGTFVGLLYTIAQVNNGIAAAFTTLSGLGPLIAAKLGPMLAAAGPIGIGIAVVLALAAAAFFAYKKFQPFHDVVDAIGRTIRDVVMTAFDWLRDNLPAVAAAFQTAFETVRSAVMTAFDAVRSAVQTAFSAVRGVVDTVIAKFVQFGAAAAALYQAIVVALTPLAQWFNANVVSTLVAGWNFVVAVFQLAATTLAGIFDFLVTILQNAVTNVGGAFSLMLAIIQPALEFLKLQFTILWTVISTIVQAIFIAIQTSVGLWVSAFMTFIGIVGPIWSGFWDVVWTMASTILQQIKNTIETVLGIIRGIFQAVTGLIHGDWGEFWQGISTIASSIFNGVRDAIGIVWDSIKSLFSIAMDTVKNTVTNGFNEMVSFISGVPGRILGALGNLGGLLVGAGEDLIRGLLSGIRNMAGAAADAAKSVVSNAVNAAKSALGIGSPSRVFIEIGQQTIAGFVVGVAKSTPAAVGQMGRFVGAITPADLRFASTGLGGLAAPAMATAGGAGTVNVYAQTNADPNEMARAMAWAMRTGSA